MVLHIALLIETDYDDKILKQKKIKQKRHTHQQEAQSPFTIYLKQR